jgi:hypothetical protein
MEGKFVNLMSMGINANSMMMGGKKAEDGKGTQPIRIFY